MQTAHYAMQTIRHANSLLSKQLAMQTARYAMQTIRHANILICKQLTKEICQLSHQESSLACSIVKYNNTYTVLTLLANSSISDADYFQFRLKNELREVLGKISLSELVSKHSLGTVPLYLSSILLLLNSQMILHKINLDFITFGSNFIIKLFINKYFFIIDYL